MKLSERDIKELRRSLEADKDFGKVCTSLDVDVVLSLIEEIEQLRGNQNGGWISVERRVDKAFDLIARANTVTLLSLGEMEALVNRALTGEFDHLIPATLGDGTICDEGLIRPLPAAPQNTPNAPKGGSAVAVPSREESGDNE